VAYQVLLICLAILLLFAGIFISYSRKYNHTDWGKKWLNLLDGINRWFCYKYHGLNADLIRLPETGGGILASNHISGLDPLLLAAACPRPIRFMIAREQYDRFGLTWFFRSIGCIPVERDKKPERAFREALRQLHAGEILAIFPHGKIHLDNDPPRKIKKGVIRLAQISGCQVFPARLEGVRGQGQLIMAVPRRSQARIKSFEPIFPDVGSTLLHLEKLTAYIEGRLHF